MNESCIVLVFHVLTSSIRTMCHYSRHGDTSFLRFRKSQSQHYILCMNFVSRPVTANPPVAPAKANKREVKDSMLWNSLATYIKTTNHSCRLNINLKCTYYSI